ncbi:asparagine synthase-related protein, partial [Gallintestinimicrobium sp.]
AYDYIPRELLDRKKTGFSVPLDKWLRGPLKNKLTDYASPAFLKQQGLFNADATAKLITDWLGAGDGGAYTGSNYSRIIWAFFIFQQWAERYLQV